jgi:hypothetical protein
MLFFCADSSSYSVSLSCRNGFAHFVFRFLIKFSDADLLGIEMKNAWAVFCEVDLIVKIHYLVKSLITNF